MLLQHPINIYRNEGDCVVEWTHTSFYEGALDGANPLFYKNCMKQPSPLLPKAMLIIYWTYVYIINDNHRGYQRCRGLGGCLWCRLSLPACCVDVLLKVFDPNEFLHQVMQILALFSGVAMLLMVRAHFVLVSSIRIYLDWFRPSKVQQVMDLQKEFHVADT